MLKPYIRFKKIQTEALMEACQILKTGMNTISKEALLRIVDLIIIVQTSNYGVLRLKRNKEDLLKIIGLTP